MGVGLAWYPMDGGGGGLVRWGFLWMGRAGLVSNGWGWGWLGKVGVPMDG